MSPKFVPAGLTELQRIGLLAELPRETLVRVAPKNRREQVPAGGAVVEEGDDGDRFYVVLTGMFTVSQASLGPRSVLRPGDYFGEVALAMEIPRTASVRALTPSTVASCDRETFDEFIRPLFAEGWEGLAEGRSSPACAARSPGEDAGSVHIRRYGCDRGRCQGAS